MPKWLAVLVDEVQKVSSAMLLDAMVSEPGI